MKLNFLLKFALLAFAFFGNIYAYEIDTIHPGDTLEVIARRNISKVKIKYSERYDEYEADIKKWNPKIKDWQNPPQQSRIYVDYPYDPYIACATSAPELNPDPIVIPTMEIAEPEPVKPEPPKVVESNVVDLKTEPEPQPQPVTEQAPVVAQSETKLAPQSADEYYFLDPKFSLYGFYAATMGNYTEDTSAQVVSSSQNFPVTWELVIV